MPYYYDYPEYAEFGRGPDRQKRRSRLGQAVRIGAGVAGAGLLGAGALRYGGRYAAGARQSLAGGGNWGANTMSGAGAAGSAFLRDAGNALKAPGNTLSRYAMIANKRGFGGTVGQMARDVRNTFTRGGRNLRTGIGRDAAMLTGTGGYSAKTYKRQFAKKPRPELGYAKVDNLTKRPGYYDQNPTRKLTRADVY